MFSRIAAGVILAGALLTRTAAEAAPQAPAATPAAGAYSDEQAGRGEQVFTRVCLECHARKDISNPDFKTKWNGRSAFDFFEQVRSTMPDSDPGSLPRGDYLDVTAYMMKLNGLPPGAAALPDDEALLKTVTLRLSAGH